MNIRRKTSRKKIQQKRKRWIKKTQRFFLWGAWRSRTALAGFADQRLNRSSNAPDLIERASFSNAMQRYNLFFRTKNEKQRNLSVLLLLLIYIKSYSQQAYSVWKWTIAWQFLCFLPHITRNHFSKGKNTGSTDVSKAFTQRGYKSIIKSI